MKCYAMITELSNRARFVKFGVSEDVAGRIVNVQCGCPLKIESVLEMDCGTSYHARVVEAALHIEHADIHASGEWFRFAEGTKARGMAMDAMKMMGERVFARAVVTGRDVGQGKAPRKFQGKTARTIRGYEPVVGEKSIAHVTVIARRKSLNLTA